MNVKEVEVEARGKICMTNDKAMQDKEGKERGGRVGLAPDAQEGKGPRNEATRQSDRKTRGVDRRSVVADRPFTHVRKACY